MTTFAPVFRLWRFSHRVVEPLALLSSDSAEIKIRSGECANVVSALTDRASTKRHIGASGFICARMVTCNDCVRRIQGGVGYSMVARGCTIQLRVLCLIRLLGLIEEEVGGQLLVLVAREVGLNDEVALEAKATQALNSLALFFGDGDLLGTWGKRRVVVRILCEQLQELLWVLCYHLRQLRVSCADLLEDRLKHLRLLLYHLS
jgi:hypothetical protein